MILILCFGFDPLCVKSFFSQSKARQQKSAAHRTVIPTGYCYSKEEGNASGEVITRNCDRHDECVRSESFFLVEDLF